jgi:hypothetical protein
MQWLIEFFVDIIVDLILKSIFIGVSTLMKAIVQLVSVCISYLVNRGKQQ